MKFKMRHIQNETLAKKIRDKIDNNLLSTKCLYLRQFKGQNIQDKQRKQRDNTNSVKEYRFVWKLVSPYK